MVDPYRIRLLEAADLQRIVEIERLSFSDPWPPGAFGDVTRAASVVVEGPGGVVGFVCTRLATGEAEILDVAVHPAHRRCGLGERLVRASLGRCSDAGAAVAYLEVRESNAAARSLYAKLAFTPVKKRVAYYRNPTEDALVLRRILTPICGVQ